MAGRGRRVLRTNSQTSALQIFHVSNRVADRLLRISQDSALQIFHICNRVAGRLSGIFWQKGNFLVESGRNVLRIFFKKSALQIFHSVMKVYSLFSKLNSEQTFEDLRIIKFSRALSREKSSNLDCCRALSVNY